MFESIKSMMMHIFFRTVQIAGEMQAPSVRRGTIIEISMSETGNQGAGRRSGKRNRQPLPRCSATPAMARAMPASSPATGTRRKVEGAPAEAPGGGRNSPASGAPWRADRRHRGSSRTYGHRQITFILGLQGEVAATKRHGGACDGWRFIPGQSSGGPDAAPSCSANPRIPCMKPRIWSLKRANSSSLNKPRVRRWQYVSRLLTGACR
jgi:hypothetical protein